MPKQRKSPGVPLNERVCWVDKLKTIEKYIEAGMRANELAAEFGVSRARIYQVLQKYGIMAPVNKKNRQFKSQDEYWAYKMLYHKRSWCKKNEVKFDLVYTDLFPLPTRCPILGLELDYDVDALVMQGNSPSIDRIDPQLGYVKGNVCVISWEANKLKRDRNEKQLRYLANAFLSIADYIKNNTKSA